MLRGLSFVFVVLCAAYTTPSGAHEWEDLTLTPPDGKTGSAVALIFAQGAEIPTDRYEPLMVAIQEAVSFPLYVSVPQCPGNAASVGLSNAIRRGKETLYSEGLPADANLYFGGHSLGGAMMPKYVEKDDDAKGQVLMGSFLTRDFKTGATPEGRPQVEFPVATLTIGGELDGLCRLTRIAEALYSQVTFAANVTSATRTMPVTVVEGMNHMQFASGEPPLLVKKRDLQSEISDDEAHARVAEITANFLTALELGSSEAWTSIETTQSESTAFVQPIVDALQMEGYAQFLPPCYCETPDEYGHLEYGTCVSQSNCTGGVPWTGSYAMPAMGAGQDGLEITAVDSMHLVTEEKPSCHLPHIHGSDQDNANPGNGEFPPLCDAPDGCKLNITTVTQQNYENSGEVDFWRLHFSVDTLDTGYLPITAHELKSKLKSRQAVYQAAGVSSVNFTEVDKEGNRCAEINQMAIDWALSKLPSTTASRFEKYGQSLEVGPDLSTCIAGPCWIWDPLRFEKDDENNKVTVKSVFMTTENYNVYPCGESKHLPCDAGFHYCKLLSPARAIEWYYVDGLRLHYSAYHNDTTN